MRGLLGDLQHREIGEGGEAWRQRARKRWCSELQLRTDAAFSQVHLGGVTWLELDGTENRYLLTGGADGSLAVYDTHALPLATSNRRSAAQREVPPVCIKARGTRGAHTYLVSGVAWYPVDTGLFVSGSYDMDVKLWDTNEMSVVSTFPLPAKVSCVAMSHFGGGASHSLIAASCLEQHLRLCDPVTGAFSHTLVGHKHPIWSVAWSLRSEFELLSGDASGQVRVWDIRRFGSLHILDQYTTAPRRSRAAATVPRVHAHELADGTGAERPSHRAASAPATLEAAVDAAWRVMENQMAHRSHMSGSSRMPAAGRPPKRPRAIGEVPASAMGGDAGGQSVVLEEGEIQVTRREEGGGVGRRPHSRSHSSSLAHSASTAYGSTRHLRGRGSSSQTSAAATARRALALSPSLAPLAQASSAPPTLSLSRSRAADVSQPSGARSSMAVAPTLLARLPSRGGLSASAPVAMMPGRAATGAIGGLAAATATSWDQRPPGDDPLQDSDAPAVAGVHGAAVTGMSVTAGGLMEDAVRAHQDAVTCVLPSPDGLYWMTAGTDSRLRLWDAVGWHNVLVGYADTHNRAIRGRRCEMNEDGGVVFHPSGSVVQVFHVTSGRLLSQLGGEVGHTESVNAVAYCPVSGQLYSGANDGRVLVWGQPPERQ